MFGNTPLSPRYSHGGRQHWEWEAIGAESVGYDS